MPGQLRRAVCGGDHPEACRQDLGRAEGAKVGDGTHGQDDLADAGTGGAGDLAAPAAAGAVRERY